MSGTQYVTYGMGSQPFGTVPPAALDQNFADATNYPSTSAPIRSLANKATDIVSILDYNQPSINSPVDKSSALDSTNGIQAAINALPAGGGALYCPVGTYAVTALTISKQCLIYGAGMSTGGTTFKPLNAASNVFTVTTANVYFRDLSFNFAVTQTGGSFIKFDTGSSIGLIENVTMSGWWIGIWLNGISNFWIKNVLLTTGVAVSGQGIRVDAGTAISLDRVFCTNAAGARPLSGITIANCGDVTMMNCSWVQCVNGCYIAPSTSQTATSIYGVKCFFDNCGTNGLFIQPQAASGAAQRMTFSECWFGSAGSYGIQIDTTAHAGTVDGVTFIDPEVVLNGAHGMGLAGSPTNTKVIGGKFAQNANAGILINGGVSNIDIIGATCGPCDNLTGNGTWGIQILAGTTNNLLISNCRLSGNTSGTISDGSTGTNRRKIDNIGYNPVGTVGITVTASPFSYTAGDSPELVYINTGTCNPIKVDGVTVYSQTNCSVWLNPGSTVQVTYSVAPGMATTKL